MAVNISSAQPQCNQQRRQPLSTPSKSVIVSTPVPSLRQNTKTSLPPVSLSRCAFNVSAQLIIAGPTGQDVPAGSPPLRVSLPSPPSRVSAPAPPSQHCPCRRRRAACRRRLMPFSMSLWPRPINVLLLALPVIQSLWSEPVMFSMPSARCSIGAPASSLAYIIWVSWTSHCSVTSSIPTAGSLLFIARSVSVVSSASPPLKALSAYTILLRRKAIPVVASVCNIQLDSNSQMRILKR